MPSPLTEPIRQLAESWRTATATSRRRIALAAVALCWVLALLLARQGTPRARIGAAAVLLVTAAAAIAWRLFDRYRLRDPGRVVRGIARSVDPARADRALRALTLLSPAGDVRSEGTSADLARLHVARALADLPSDRIVERAARVAAGVAAAAIMVGVCALGVALANAWSVLEGADVLVARQGAAPVPMHWLDAVEVVARPPDYLHEGEHHEVAFYPLALPYGTTVTVRGVTLHPGRRLLLTDGTTEVPFVDDGAGAVVARWNLAQSARLHVVARFGSVVVREPDELALESLPDQAPVVTLEGAPREVVLLDQTEDLPVRYEATDDHGLREVHLVLRSGTREERRVLSHLDGETRVDRGGLVLKLRDPFLRKSHAPVEVTVEAKDNDPLTGPKWGASPALTVIPPGVGEPEARRLDALRALRDQLVDSLAWRLRNEPPADAAARRTFLADEKTRADADEDRLRATLADTYGGVRVARRLGAMLQAQAQKTRAAVAAEARAPSAVSHAAVVKATEKFTLVVDAAIRGLGFHDSRESAKQLADVADELASWMARHGDQPDPRDLAWAHGTDASERVLGSGGRTLLRLGSLGRDLGEIVDAYLARVRRGRDGDDYVHAELAARDLAARLREPDPSFGARGSVGRGGGEAGGGRGTPGEDGEGGSGDEVDQAQQEAEQDLERLAQDHAGEIAKVEQDLSGATSDDEMKQLREEARKHAEAIREAVKELPTVGRGSDSWTSKGAAARELGEQMAGSLEQAHPDEAAQSGRSALGSLDEAKKILQKGAWFEDPAGEEQKRVDEARRKLEAEQKWVEEAMRQMRQRAAERARKQLEQGGEEEGKLAERARELGERGRDKGALPDKALESIEDAEHAARQAAQALQQGDAEKGLERQREAQRDLEQARQQLGTEDEPPSESGADEGNGRNAGGAPVAIPGKGQHRGPEDFRRRVVRGLGQPSSGGLRDAVHRYAEGLLR